MVRLACPGTWGAFYSLVVVLSAMALDPLLIFFSYGLIGRALQGVGSTEDRWKAGQTCAAHLSAVLLFYTPMILLALINRFKLPLPLPAHTLLSYVHFLLPPLINPVLYSVKMKEIREKILKRLLPRKVGCALWGKMLLRARGKELPMQRLPWLKTHFTLADRLLQSIHIYTQISYFFSTTVYEHVEENIKVPENWSEPSTVALAIVLERAGFCIIPQSSQ